MEIAELEAKIASKYRQLQYAPDDAKIKILRNIRYMRRKVEEKVHAIQQDGENG